MTEPQDFLQRMTARGYPEQPARDMPAWTKGIRALYDAITQEPLPTDFQRLLEELAKQARNKA